MHPLSGKKILVLGLGVSGLSAARFLSKRGAAVTAVDQRLPSLLSNPQIQELSGQGMQVLDEEAPCRVSDFALIVASPGIQPSQRHYSEALRSGIDLIGEIELGCRELKWRTEELKCIGVTGTNGKTTVTLLIEHLLREAGIKAAAVGNVGTPLTTVLDSVAEHSVFVIELSSFQLETLHTPCLDSGVILNITPDHLDRYASMQEYAKAKLQMARLIKPSGILFMEEATKQQYGNEAAALLNASSSLCTYGYGNEEIHSDTFNIYSQGTVWEVPESFRGRRSHDLENLMAAYGICSEMGVHIFSNAVRTFKKPDHRIQFVRTHAGVNYYDDSKGTNIDAVMRAVEIMAEPVHLIAGGVDKGSPYHPWITRFGQKVKAIYAIGQASQQIKRDLADHFRVELCVSLEEAILRASQAAKAGEVVLLSPGCSSFDMFKDYAHRGNEFKRIVNAL